MQLLELVGIYNYMDICNYEIKIKFYWILIVFILFIFSFIFLLFILISSYFLFKMFKINIDNNNITFNKYNKETQYILNKYGDYKITQVYIIRQPISKFVNIILNMITLNDFKRIFDNNNELTAYHASVIFKIKLPNNLNKFVLVEKNPSLSISEYFNINNTQNIKSFSVKKNKYTLNQILDKTNKRIGNDKFFNWHFYKNNCQDFVKELLITFNKPNYMDNFMSHEIITSKLYSCGFNVHAINFLVTISNIFDKYFFRI